jgi:polyhydroxyalkanoate synthesis repressor PhaR
MSVIKRYSNRKLYDTQAKRYVTLEGIAELIRNGEEVQVVDHETGDDITGLIQAQTIFELERKLKGGLPRSVLTNLIRASSDTLSQLRGALTPANWKARVDAEIERRVHSLVDHGLLPEVEGLTLLEGLLAAGEPDPCVGVSEQELERALQERGVPQRADLERLRDQVQALAAELDQLADHHHSLPRPKTHRSARKSIRRR